MALSRELYRAICARCASSTSVAETWRWRIRVANPCVVAKMMSFINFSLLLFALTPTPTRRLTPTDRLQPPRLRLFGSPNRTRAAVTWTGLLSAAACPCEFLCPASPDEHLNAHHQPPAGLECSQLCLHLFSYCPATCFGQREVRLWQLPRPGFNWSPVLVERLNGPLARLALYPDITKAGQPEQVFEPIGICQREGEVKRVMLIRQMAAEDIGEDAPH